MRNTGARIRLGHDGIGRIRFPHSFDVTLPVMEELFRRHCQLTTAPRPLLIHAESVASAEYETRQFTSRDGFVALVSDMGVVVRSLFTRAMADVFMRLHKPPYPTQIFREEQDALV